MKSISLCYKHKDRDKVPPACNICRRINVERTIVEKVVADLLAADYYLAVNDQGGDDDIRPDIPTNFPEAILEELMETDDDFLAVYTMPGEPLPMGWVRFVYGNDGWDVISDYTTNLDSVLAPVMEWIDAQQ